MKMTIERQALLSALAHVQSVVERRNTIPILSNALIEARGGALRITATDYAADTILWPRPAPLLQSYADIRVEISIDLAFAMPAG